MEEDTRLDLESLAKAEGIDDEVETSSMQSSSQSQTTLQTPTIEVLESNEKETPKNEITIENEVGKPKTVTFRDRHDSSISNRLAPAISNRVSLNIKKMEL